VYTGDSFSDASKPNGCSWVQTATNEKYARSDHIAMVVIEWDGLIATAGKSEYVIDLQCKSF
jgi:hypothetical protein